MSSNRSALIEEVPTQQRPDNQADSKYEYDAERERSQPSRLQRFRTWSKTSKDFLVVHITRHVGPGVLASIAYFDPGNWSVDLQAGSQYGYKLLFVVLLAGLGAILLQTMAARLGCVTGLDLAQHCRLLLHSRPKHKLLFRRVLLYPMYVVCEVGIIATDLAELLGSAIGLSLLIPAIPLWGSVLITSVDVIFVLAMAPTSSGRPVRAFELLLMSLVLVVFVVFIILIKKIDPYWPDVFNGYLPSKTLFKPGALYTSIGILGATVMPHALFLGSSLATLDRVSSPVIIATLPSLERKRTYTIWQQFGRAKRALFWVQRSPQNELSIPRNEAAPTHELNEVSHTSPAVAPSSESPRSTGEIGLAEDEGKNVPQLQQTQAHGYRGHQNNSLAFIRAHLGHAIIDIVMSLLGFAVSINSAILILGAAAFYYGGGGEGLDAGLFDAHDLIRDRIGRPAAFLFALALLCSGQSASITATLAGQIVSEGFIEWRISPLARRTITRLIGLVPSMIVAVAVGRQGIDALLVASQVALSIVLPFVIFPLVYLASSEVVMRVPKPEGGFASFKNNWPSMSLGYLIFAVVVVANSYVIVTLAMGKSG